MKIAAAYIRVSTNDQLEYSPSSQLKAIHDYAKKNSMTLPDKFVFLDEGISGRCAENRPAFMQMIGIAKSSPSPFNVILVWKFSRFARNREDSILYKSILRKECNVDVISISEQLGEDKTSILIEALLEAMDEYYSINLAEEVKRGMTEKAKCGGILSIPPFGYTVSNGTFIPHPLESNIIKYVFNDYAHGVGMLKIARNLNECGIRTHRGNKIENRTVEYWLNNPVYIGKIRWTPTGAAGRNFNNPDSIIAPGKHEPIIDVQLWNIVQNKLLDQKKNYQKHCSPKIGISHWLTGIVRCGVCGCTMVNCNGYLYCNNYNKGVCTGNGGISIIKAEKIILDTIYKLIPNSNNIKISVIPFSENKSDTFTPLLSAAENKLTRIKAAYECGIDTLDEYKSNKQKITNEINILKQKIESQRIQTNSQNNIKTLSETALSSMHMFSDTNLSMTVKSKLAHTFIHSIKKHSNHFEIIFF